MSQTRRLAAILAADVAGYSRLMGTNEEGTHERLKAHLAQLVDPKIKEHRGRIVKNTGDGFLAEFASVVDAVRCAVEVQRGMIDREPEMPDDQRIRLRIGIKILAQRAKYEAMRRAGTKKYWTNFPHARSGRAYSSAAWTGIFRAPPPTWATTEPALDRPQ